MENTNVLDRGIPILDREPLKGKEVGEAVREIIKTAKPIESDNVSIPKSEWEAMKETVRLSEEGGTRKIPKVNDRVAKITLFEGKIVTKILKSWIERKFGKLNNREEDRLFAKIVTEDKVEHTVDYLDFINEADRIICSIKKIDKKDASIIHGKFETENSNPRENKTFRSNEMEDIETKTDDDYTLEITSGERKGEKVTLNHLALNI